MVDRTIVRANELSGRPNKFFSQCDGEVDSSEWILIVETRRFSVVLGNLQNSFRRLPVIFVTRARQVRLLTE